MKPIVGIAIAICVCLVSMSGAQAQQRRTLWDMLFGNDEPVRQQAPPRTDVQTSSSPSVTNLEDLKPAVEKVESATRLAVFGDSLAVDLAKALERAHADDPNIVVLGEGVSSSGFVRDDFYDWNGEISAYIAQDAFDIAVMIIGINDRQALGANKPLTDEWKSEYQNRLTRFLDQMRQANKPVIWVGLPPMRGPKFSAAMSQISSIHKLAAFAGGAEFVDIYERFVDDEGNYSAYGPDLNGQVELMRKSDGIHLSSAGSDKVAFYIQQSLKRFYQGGAVSFEIADVLAGTDAETMIRMPFQGLGQIRRVEIAGAVIPLNSEEIKASELIVASPPGTTSARVNFDDLINAPVGRADSFGVGVEPGGAAGPPL